MKIFINNLIIIVIFINGIQSDCDVCQSTNNVACHKENQYSLCIKGKPTRDYITCPENHVCTPDPYVCYPLPDAQPSCVRNGDMCGVCSFNKVYACLNETTIAFCYGQDKPYEGADVSYCLDNTVCDIFSEHGFCTEKHLAKPSCVTTSEEPTTTELTTTGTTTQYSTTTVSSTTKTTTTTEISSTTATKPSPTTTVPTTTESIITTTEISTTKATTTTESSTTKPTITTEIPSTSTTKKSTTTSLPTTSTTTTTTTGSSTTKPTITTEIPTVKPATTTTEPSTTTSFPTISTTTTTETSATESTSTTTEPSTTTSISTSIITTTESTVPSEPNDLDEFCKQQAGEGFYYAGDPTCTTFIICMVKGDTLIGLKKSCQEGLYFPPGAKFCSDKKTDECVEPSTTESTTVESSTTTSTTTTTTEATVPSGPRDPEAVCKDKTDTGSYPNGDPTCKTFTVCYFIGESLKGIQKSCKPGQYFSPTTRLCTEKKPEGCI